MMFVSQENVETCTAAALAVLQAQSARAGKCECIYDRGKVGEYCLPHLVLGLLVPSVEAHETPQWVAS